MKPFSEGEPGSLYSFMIVIFRRKTLASRHPFFTFPSLPNTEREDRCERTPLHTSVLVRPLGAPFTPPV